MNHENLKSQMELSYKAINEIKKQNRIFESVIDEAVKGAPEKDKKGVQEVQSLLKQVNNLSKNGELQKAHDLIIEFNNGRKNNQ